MGWEEIVLSFGAIIFAIALIPSIISDDKPDLRTSLTTGLVLLAFTAAYISLGLTFAAATVFITAGFWFTLAFQVIRRNRKR
jgi:hypothetical protein